MSCFLYIRKRQIFKIHKLKIVTKIANKWNKTNRIFVMKSGD